MSKLTHLDEQGHARMVDVGDKQVTRRTAVAAGEIHMRAETLQQVVTGRHSKGDVLAAARIAGIMAAKQTSNLVPLCHPLIIDKVTVDLTPAPESNRIDCEARVECNGRTGVEMEALTAVQIALLTIYDMCKAVDRGMTINSVRVLEKSGGRSGDWRRPAG